MENIITALEQIEEKGSFCGKRMTDMDKLNLEIKSFGPLQLPLTARHAKALIKLAKPAKFGLRDKTLLDHNVRNAWEISKSHIKIDNITWNKTLKSTLESLKNDLGLPETAVLKASLHNLLIYEPGQFFEYHQDSEKINGMVATLVVVLPSSHTGGTLVIENQGDKKQFQSSRFPLDKLTFIAFYADCHHKIKEIKEGYRIALTYNLVLENYAKKISISSQSKSQDNLIHSLRSYFIEENSSTEASTRQDKSPKQCIYLLDHNYTQKGLSWNHLKNGDALRAEALTAAADALDLEIYMALADVQETWDCEDDYDPYAYRRKRKYSFYEDEDEEEENQDVDDVVLTDLIDSSTVLKYWIDRKNKPVNYKEYYVSDDYIGWTKASDEFEPFKSEHEGFMGNYGNTMDRWYHRAAIVLWQKKDHYAVLFKIDPSSIMNELLDLTKKKDQVAHVRQIISSLLPYWSRYLTQHSDKSLISRVLKLALYVKDAQLAQSMIAIFDIRALTPERISLFLSLQESYGTAWCIDILKEWTKHKDSWGSVPKCENISEIVEKISARKNNHKELTDWLLAYQLQKMKASDASYKKSHTRANRIESIPERIKDMMDFIKSCVMVNHSDIYRELSKHLIDHMALYPPIELVSVIYFFEENVNCHELETWDYKNLFDYVFRELENEKALGLRKVDDWSIKETWSCSCQDCGSLNEFLKSSTTQTITWPMGKDRRSHIHGTIDGLSIPVTHETQHTGSPHKLILTKTDKLYSQAKKRYDNIEKALFLLTKIRKKQSISTNAEIFSES